MALNVPSQNTFIFCQTTHQSLTHLNYLITGQNANNYLHKSVGKYILALLGSFNNLNAQRVDSQRNSHLSTAVSRENVNQFGGSARRSRLEFESSIEDEFRSVWTVT